MTILPLVLPLVLTLALACGDKDADDSGTATTDGGTTADGGTTDGGTADGGTAADGGTEAPEVHRVEPAQLALWFEDETELLLVNVHIPYEGEIPGTDLHVPYDDDPALLAAAGSDLDRLVVVYCKTGPMSATAAETLVAAGYTSIYDLVGGMEAWEDAGYELYE